LRLTGRRPTRLFVQAVTIAEKVAKYRHAQLSAVRLAGDINATLTDNASLDELLVKIKSELVKLGPLIDLDAIREQQGVENRLPVTVNGSEAERNTSDGLAAGEIAADKDTPNQIGIAFSPLRRRPPGTGASSA
jgi:hypothetical protein